MKISKIAEAVVLWLPGFEPEGTAVEQSIAEEALPALPAEVVNQPRDSIGYVRKVVAALPPKAVWPYLSAEALGAAGDAGKCDANLDAIDALKAVEADQREPTEAERAALNRYTGWGGLPKMFGYIYDDAWRNRQNRLKATLTEAEYDSAKDSTPNAHYTSHEVIAAMWAMVERLGFKGGRVLEPAAGAGYFIGAMPTHLAQTSTVTAVELDAVSARVVKALYGGFGVKVHACGFEEVNAPEGFYDLVISNVPFGNYQVNDASGKWSSLSIHDYFIARSLELVREGGLVAVITSSFTLDKHTDTVRQRLASMADLVGAIRLPRSAFKGIANTEVTTDILILQRRGSGEATDRGWCGAPVSVTDELRAEGFHSDATYMTMNPYYAAHPDRVIGKIGMYGGGYSRTVGVVFDGDLATALAEQVGKLPENIVPARKTGAGVVEASPRAVLLASAEYVKPGAYVIAEGNKLAVSVDGKNLQVIEGTITTAKARRLRAIIPVRDAARRVLATQAASDDDALLERYRLALLASYDAFVAEFGPISKRFNQSAYREDPDFPLLLSLEHWDEEAGTARKADIFYRRTVGAYRRVQRCETPEEALQVCLAEHARVVPVRIAELLEVEANAAMELLQAKGLVFIDPETEAYVQADAYLSGDVKTKLAQAQHADGAGGDYADNIVALEQVIPADLLAGDIAVKLGSTWVPLAVYGDFMAHLFGSGTHVGIERNTTAGTWRVKGSPAVIAQTQTWGTSRVGATQLIEMALNQTTPRVTDPDLADSTGKKRKVNTEETVAAREKQEAIKDEFTKWVWADEERAEMLVRAYNDAYNRIVPRKFDGSHLILPGFSGAYTLREHQRNAVWRCVSSADCTLLAHVVGAGKTLTMICAVMEMRRTGQASKPVIAVPNHMLEQFAAEFLRAYPAANVLIASKDDMAPARRKTLIARMATGDWDAVVLTHASFEKIPLPQGYTEAVIEDALANMEALHAEAREARDNRAVKEMAKRRKVWKVRLEQRAEGNGKDDVLDFAEIGFDALIVDEAHFFKNLYRFTTLQMPGLPTNDSFRAFDMSVKVGYVQEKKSPRGVIFATGTPIANSVAEMWVMQHYLQPRTLVANGLDAFDAWAANFGEPVTAMELAPDGSSYRVHTRFARFVNVPELLTVFREVADIQTADMLELPVPKAIREIVTAKPSDGLKAYVASLVKRAEKIRSGRVSPTEDNMLAVTNDGRKAATDFRLVGGTDYTGSKISLVAENVVKTWKDTAESRGTQLVFLDMGTPTAGRWLCLYDDLRERLERQGIPGEQIAYIHDAKTDKAKEALFADVRSGKVRVLVGSTSKMGTGMNVQNRLVALHHVDGPWRPADVEQREGRIIRQGNTNAVVKIYRYVTEGTFDAYIWQTLETKARFIAQVMRGDTGIRSLEDAELAALTYAEVKALASGNPMVIEKAGVDAEVMRLSMLKSTWARQQAENRRALASLPGRIARGQKVLAELEDDAVEAAKTAETMAFKLSGKPANAEDFGLRLMGAAYMLKDRGEIAVGSVGGFDVSLEGRASFLSTPKLVLSRKRIYEVGDLNKTPRGVVAQIERALKLVVQDEVSYAKRRVQQDEALLAELQKVGATRFEQEERLAALLVRKAEIDALLCPSVTEEAAADVVEATPSSQPQEAAAQAA